MVSRNFCILRSGRSDVIGRTGAVLCRRLGRALFGATRNVAAGRGGRLFRLRRTAAFPGILRIVRRILREGKIAAGSQQHVGGICVPGKRVVRQSGRLQSPKHSGRGHTAKDDHQRRHCLETLTNTAQILFLHKTGIAIAVHRRLSLTPCC